MKSLIGILIVLCALLAGCAGGDARQRMDLADSLMEQYPDSALAILQAVDSSKLTTKKLQARYALLNTQARVKTYNNGPADTAALPLLDYYSDHGSDYDRMRAAFYKAEIYSTFNNYRKQIFHLCEAKKLAQQMNDNYWLAKIYELEADIFQNNFHYHNAVKLRESIIENYKIAKKDRNVDFAYMDLAFSLHAVHNNERAFAIIDSMIDKAYNTCDTAMELYGLTMKCHMCINTCRYNEADSVRMRQYELSGDTIAVCFDDLYRDSFIDLNCKGNINDGLLNDIRNSLSNKVDSSRFYHVLTNLYFKRGELDKSLLTLDSMLTLNTAVFGEILHQSIVAEQLNYSKLQLDETRTQNRQLVLLVIGSLIILVILVLSFALYWWRMKALRFKKDAMISTISLELSNSNEAFNQQHSHLQAIKRELENEIDKRTCFENQILIHDKKFTRIFDLYTRQWGLISGICTTYMNSNDKSEKNSGYNKLTKVFAEMSSSDNLNELVAGIEDTHKGIFSDLKSIYPSLKQSDIYMLALAHTGASVRIISIILDANQSTLYRRRDRIAEKIKESSHKSRQKLLEFIGCK